MAAPVGNQFWKLRTVHGKEKLFAEPELLWDECCKYFNWCDAHPWWKNEAVKSGDMAGQIIKVPVARPYTLTGLCIYLNVSESYWRQLRKQDNLTEEYISVITRVEEIIWTQKFEGAAVGAFNHNIIARDLGLVDKGHQDVKHTGAINIIFEEAPGCEPIKDEPEQD